MKKLMIGLFAVCAAVAAQAAYVDWQYEGANAKNDTSWGTSTSAAANGYTAYLLTAAAYDGIKTSMTKSAIAGAALDSSTLIFEKTQKSKSYYTTHAEGKTVASVRTVEASSGNYYVILANDDGYSIVANNVAITAFDTPGEAGSGKTAGITLSAQDNVTMITAARQAYSGIPEPTSGILMLVGLGALALRRRRA